jgi:hypothetical protein
MGSESPAQIQRGREQELNRKNVYFLENVEICQFLLPTLKDRNEPPSPPRYLCDPNMRDRSGWVDLPTTMAGNFLRELEAMCGCCSALSHPLLRMDGAGIDAWQERGTEMVDVMLDRAKFN